MECWKANPTERPSFQDLTKMIDQTYGENDAYNQPIYGDPIDFGYLEAAP